MRPGPHGSGRTDVRPRAPTALCRDERGASADPPESSATTGTEQLRLGPFILGRGPAARMPWARDPLARWGGFCRFFSTSPGPTYACRLWCGHPDSRAEPSNLFTGTVRRRGTFALTAGPVIGSCWGVGAVVVGEVGDRLDQRLEGVGVAGVFVGVQRGGVVASGGSGVLGGVAGFVERF